MPSPQKATAIHPVREGIVVGLIVWLSAGLSILGLYNWTHQALIQDVRADLEQFARIAAPLVDGDLHEQLVSPAQLNSEAHRKVLAPLVRFHRAIPSVAYVYTCVSVSNEVHFVLDTSTSSNELNRARAYVPSLIMDVYKSPDPAMLRALGEGVVISTDRPFSDEFGTFMSGYAPIFNSAGQRVGIVGVDLSLADYLARLKAVQQVAGFSYAGLTVFAVLVSLAVHRVRHRARDADRLNQQAALMQREQQRILRAVLDNTPLGIWLVNVAGRPLFVNRGVCTAAGIPDERFLAAPHYARLFDEAMEQNCMASDRAALAQDKPHVSHEELRFVDGQLHKLEIVKMRMLDEAGQPTGIIGLYMDVTERDRVQAALLESEQRYRALLEVSPNAIFINRADRVTYINPAGLRLFGAERPEQILGRDPAELFHPDCRATVQAHLRTRLAEQKTIGLIEKTITRLDGSAVEVEISAAPFTDQGVTAIQLILRDITYRKKLEGKLRQSQKMEAIGTLAGGIAHDFNNLLTIIQGNTSLILLETGISKDSAESLRQISEATTRAATLTQQLLTFSRKTHVQLQLIDLNEVISKLVKMLRRLIREDIDLECHYSGKPILLLADPGMIDQILLNLTVNARDAMPAGGRLTIRAEHVQISAADQQNHPGARPGPFAKLSVTDSGTGIDPQHLARIFDPFFTTKDIGKGTGLGLATVHGIVEQHQGWIEVDSRPGAGTTFRVFLPIHETAPAENPAAESPGIIPSGHETVLLVEDEAALLNLISRILRRQGYQVLEATSGVAALELWKKHAAEIDLLLTDIVMPQGVSGVALAETLQAERPGLKILLTSGYHQEPSTRPTPASKKWRVLEKPCSHRHILEAIRQCLDT